ncbi:MAG: hypothetical protein F9K40_01525 [Kofleriaceae bacterium]|nr:MAG: hypothetical protein F9K40_01525 [Kofleriaceae bacterium]MBZ0119868.1 hypothetical protein [Sandaracinaceae bacterium]
MAPGPRDTDGEGTDGEDAFDLTLGDIVERTADEAYQGDVDLALGSDIHSLPESPPVTPPRTMPPHDLEAVLHRYLLDLDDADER